MITFREQFHIIMQYQHIQHFPIVPFWNTIQKRFGYYILNLKQFLSLFLLLLQFGVIYFWNSPRLLPLKITNLGFLIVSLVSFILSFYPCMSFQLKLGLEAWFD